jgi:hypothetical protein
MHAEASSTGAQFLLLGIASPIEVMPPSIKSVLIGRMDDFDADRPAQVLAQIGERHGFDVASLIPAFRKRIGDSESAFDEFFLNCDGHLSSAKSNGVACHRQTPRLQLLAHGIIATRASNVAHPRR